jgi:hypothetical protein
MRHIVSPAVRAHFLGEHQDDVLFLPIDAHELAQPTALAYFRRMIALLEPVLQRHQLTLPADSPFALTDDERAMQLLFGCVDALLARNERLSLVFCLDEFDVAFLEVEPYFFRVLLALRGRSNRHVNYLVASNNVPALICDVRSRKVVREVFSDLFNGNIRGVKPLMDRDALDVIKDVLTQTSAVCPSGLQQRLMEVTGCHLALLRASVIAFVEGNIPLRERDSVAQIAEKLLHDMTVVSKCEQLWNHLSDIEQYCLKAMQKGQISKKALVQQHADRLVNEALHTLVLKGVLVEVVHNKLYQCFSPLLLAYIRQQFFSSLSGMQIELARQRVWVDGVLLSSHLTAKEFKLLCHLAEHAGEVCPREDTTKAVYGEEYNPRRDDARLDALVERTRKRLGDDPRSPRFLETVRGMGHRLNEYLGERSS